jgi:putative flippase GtrA
MCPVRPGEQPGRMAATACAPAPGSTVAGGSAPLPAVGLLTGDSTPAQFARFVLVGGSANALYAGLFLVLAGFGDQAANLVGVVASTALANELHRRLTFRAGDRAGWAAAQWAGGGLAVVGLATSGLTLAALDAWTVSAGPLVSVLAVCAVSGAVGLARFGGLRWVLVVRPGPGGPVPAVHTS